MRISIAYRLSLYVLLVTCCVLGIVMSTIYYYSYQRELFNIDVSVEQIRTAHLPSIASGVWDFADDRLRAEVNTIASRPFIDYVQLRMPDRTISIGEHQRDRELVYDFNVHHEIGGNVATLFVQFSKDRIRKAVFTESVKILQFVALPMLAMIIAILLIFRILVTRHLRDLAEYARMLSLDTLDKKFRFSRRGHSRTSDELDFLLASIDQMRSNLLDQVKGRQQTEAQLEESQQTYREIFNATADALMIHNAETGRLIDVNQATLDFFGYPREEMIGMAVGELSAGKIENEPETYTDELARDKIFLAVDEGPQTFEWLARNKKGENRWVEVMLKSSMINSEQRVLAAVRDIGERKQRERDYARLAAAIEQAAEDVIITTPEGVIEYVNPAFEEGTGYSRDEVIGLNPSFLKSGKHDDAFYKEMWETITAGHVWSGQIVNRKKSGELTQQDATISPIFDGSRNIIGFVSLKRDISEQIRLEAQLRQSQKMQAIGTLAGGIAHDFNNILSVIIGYTSLALNDLSDGKATEDHLKKVFTAGQRAQELVAQILAFSRQVEKEKKPIRIQTIAKEVTKLLRGSIPSSIEIKANINNECAPVIADPSQIHQVMMNLCTNAYHAMREHGGTLGISLAEEYISAEKAAIDLALSEGYYNRLTVSDNGHGMTPEIKERIFEPYFTTKEVGDGTGMGLATVHSIVKSFKGAISVYSEPGMGTTFHVYLPLCEVPSRPEHEKVENTPLPVGVERVLLVDDEPEIAKLGKIVLDRLGYEVTLCSSGTEALEKLKAHPQGYEVLVTDLAMPGLNGIDLAVAALKVEPNLPVIICTGFAEAITEDRAREIGIRSLVMKPILGQDLAREIRRVIDIDTQTTVES